MTRIRDTVPVRGAGLAGVAELTQEFGAGRVVQIVTPEWAGRVIQFAQGGLGPGGGARKPMSGVTAGRCGADVSHV